VTSEETSRTSNPNILHFEFAEITVYQCFAGILLFLAIERNST